MAIIEKKKGVESKPGTSKFSSDMQNRLEEEGKRRKQTTVLYGRKVNN